jgi:hypothetical protein
MTIVHVAPKSKLPECAICLDPISAEPKPTTLACTHIFHKACIEPWLKINQSCPTCRTSTIPESVAPQPRAIRPIIPRPAFEPVFMMEPPLRQAMQVEAVPPPPSQEPSDIACLRECCGGICGVCCVAGAIATFITFPQITPLSARIVFIISGGVEGISGLGCLACGGGLICR